MITVIVHVPNEPAFLADIEELPSPSDSVLIFTNPRKRDGGPLSAMDEEATTFIYPWTRVNFIEVLAERGDREELIEFFRED